MGTPGKAPMMYRVKKRPSKRKIGVIDFETDPFKFGRLPRPFCVEFLSEDICKSFWGDDCAEQLVHWLETELTEPYLIYAHNGGKFDFWFIHSYVSNPIRVINSRIVSCKLFHHTLRDSFAIIPVALAVYNKIKIDYTKFERHKRQKNKPEILRYLHQDCLDLLTLVTSFVERFGPKLTVGTTAMSQLQKFHTFTRSDESEDSIFRQFYYGGRVEAFRSGILKGPWEVYDINSSYPKSMRDYSHPIGGNWDIESKLPRSFKRPFFIHFEGTNAGALPSKLEDGELTFNLARGEFFACSHELEISLDLGLVKIEKIHTIYRTQETISFDAYVNHWYEQKVAAKAAGDKIGELFAKFMLNSAYGKFGTNPLKFKDWFIAHDPDEETEAEEMGYEIASDFESFSLYNRQSEIRDKAFFDVSIAASITSASRAQLMLGLQQATDPIYCDTDSIICRKFSGEVSNTILGGWKKEKGGKFVAIAGKKLYALYDSPNDKEAIKIASKGGTLTLKQMIDIAKGGEFEYHNPAPNFSLSGRRPFIPRTFRKTVKPVASRDLH